MNALANPEVGKFLNENCVSSFQKVATFKIVTTPNGALPTKQGGNVAAYFCAPDGRVLHCVAGPLDAGSFLREAKWVVDTTKKAIAESKGDGGKFKAMMRTAHAQSPIFGGHFERRLQILRETLRDHRVDPDVQQVWIDHTLALRDQITADKGSECKDTGVVAAPRSDSVSPSPDPDARIKLGKKR